jgi:predicted Rdx family selenoprotein
MTMQYLFGRLRIACLGACALLIVGCALPKSAAPPAAISGFAPLSPHTLGGDRRAQQVLRAAFATQELTLTSVVDVHGDELNVVGVTPTGQRVFALKLIGTQLTVDARDAATGIPPQQLLNDLQLAYWPLAQLRQAFAGSIWRVKEIEAHTRRLYRDDKLVAEVHYADPDPWSGRFWLVNFQFGYSLAVESRPLEKN